MPENVENLVLEQLGAIWRDIADGRTLTLQNSDSIRRLDRRMSELRDDLELMLKAEPRGRLGHFETIMEQRLDALGERIGHLEKNR